ncbi:hypothetical protein YC2023_108138 [Brassica napus]
MTTGRINRVAFINQDKTTSYSRKHMESGTDADLTVIFCPETNVLSGTEFLRVTAIIFPQPRSQQTAYSPLRTMHKLCKDARITSAGLCAPDQFNKHKTMLVKKLRRIVGLYNWKTDETRPRPCKRENLKLGAKRSTGKVPGKFTGDNPAIDLNPALDSVGPNSPTLRTEPFGYSGYTRTSVCVRQHTQDVRGRPSAHTGRPAVHQYTYQHAPWTVRVILAHVGCLFSTHRTSVSTRRTSVAVRVCPCVRQCTQDVRQHTQDVRQHTQDVRGCPCVSVCPSVHTGRPSAHTGRPSAHAGRPSAHAGHPWLSVCVRVSVSAHRMSVSTHRTSVSTRRTSVSTRRTSVAVRVCPCVRQHTQDVRQYTQYVRQHTKDVRGRPSAHTGHPSVHRGRPWPSVSTHRASVSTRRTSVCVRVSVSTHRTSVSTHRTSVSTHRTSVSTHRTSVVVRQYTYQHAGPSCALFG